MPGHLKDTQQGAAARSPPRTRHMPLPNAEALHAAPQPGVSVLMYLKVPPANCIYPVRHAQARAPLCVGAAKGQHLSLQAACGGRNAGGGSVVTHVGGGTRGRTWLPAVCLWQARQAGVSALYKWAACFKTPCRRMGCAVAGCFNAGSQV